MPAVGAFGRRREKYLDFSTEINHFYRSEISRYNARACYRDATTINIFA